MLLKVTNAPAAGYGNLTVGPSFRQGRLVLCDPLGFELEVFGHPNGKAQLVVGVPTGSTLPPGHWLTPWHQVLPSGQPTYGLKAIKQIVSDALAGFLAEGSRPVASLAQQLSGNKLFKTTPVSYKALLHQWLKQTNQADWFNLVQDPHTLHLTLLNPQAVHDLRLQGQGYLPLDASKTGHPVVRHPMVSLSVEPSGSEVPEGPLYPFLQGLWSSNGGFHRQQKELYRTPWACVEAIVNRVSPARNSLALESQFAQASEAMERESNPLYGAGDDLKRYRQLRVESKKIFASEQSVSLWQVFQKALKLQASTIPSP